MRAAVQFEAGKALEVEEVEGLGVGPGEVRVKLGSSGVCHSDLSILNGTLPLAVCPSVLGHEGAGTVTELGEGVTDFSEGDHVILSWVTPCGTCPACVVGESYRCRIGFTVGDKPRFKARGLDAFATINGLATFAEETVVDQRVAIKIDPDVPMSVAALIGCGVMTGVGSAINVAKVRPGSSVAVIGCGGVGISAIQGARIAGAAEILAVDRVEDKLETARRFGASHVATPEQLADAVATITGGDGFDYGIEALGRPETVKMTWDATRAGGTAVIVGIGTDIMSLIPLAELGSKALVNSVYGGAEVRTDFHKMIRLWRTGRLDLEGMITNSIDLADINDAFAAMERGEGVRTIINYA